MKNIDIEKLESKYLEKFYHFLKFAEDEMLLGPRELFMRFLMAKA